MKIFKPFLLILAFGLFFISCEQNKTTKQKFEDKMKNIKQTAKDVANDVEDGVKKTTKKVKKDLD